MSNVTWKMRIGAAFALVGMWTGSVGAQSGDGANVPGPAATSSLEAPAPWIQEDPGAQAYARAREHLNGGRHREAAREFARLRAEYPRSGYVADSYYYQAFALFRMGARDELRQARELLRTQLDEHPDAGTAGDARELLVRVEAGLARQGDARAARNITRQAQEACGPEDELRAAALNALLNMNKERAIPILRRVLEDRDECSAELRSQAVFLLSQKMDEASVDILLDLAHRDPDPSPEVREQAVFWLSQVRTSAAVDALAHILRESDDPEIQENALFALSEQRSERSTAILREFAERSDLSAELRETALFWIGQGPGGSRYLMDLWGRLNDPELKENILHSIAQNGGDEAREWLVARAMDPSEDMNVREAALFWAGQSGAFTIDQLRGLWGGFEETELKEQVIFVASQRDERAAVDFLMEVAEDPENGELRETAIFWLGQSDDPRVPDFLLRIIGR